ncbi:glucosidase 2 subunit beta-like [Anneissia japonica]|uniref:glucosidase 2 subunit beta-like n=1 Tax=Anneissia japonica TaxID=1529436 RepID=UPI0014256A5D|nr:glucosidase 2 subunit beta-like [Anneissia japonica]
MMKVLRGGRTLRWLMMLLGLAIFYILFQGLILRILSKDSKRRLKLLEEQAALEFAVPRGVRVEDKEVYRPKSVRGFRCLDGSKYIPWKNINDDYCDCTTDGSDEPGTSACEKGRFFCIGNGEYIVASRVNDGICDCCDGTDEWDRPFSLNKVKGNPVVEGLEISPCRNFCKDLIDHKYVNAQQRLGLRLKRKYILAGKEHTNGIYGKEGEFYKLSKECFQYSTAKSKYVVCPYRYVREDNGQFFYNMGRRTVFEGKKKDGTNVIMMVNGDSRHCPGEIQRKTQVEYICGLNDHVINIHEERPCIYTLRFSTPAGC